MVLSCLCSQESVVKGRLPEIKVVLYLAGSAQPWLWESPGQGVVRAHAPPSRCGTARFACAAPPLVRTVITVTVPLSEHWGQAPGSWVEFEVPALHTLWEEDASGGQKSTLVFLVWVSKWGLIKSCAVMTAWSHHDHLSRNVKFCWKVSDFVGRRGGGREDILLTLSSTHPLWWLHTVEDNK